MRFALPLFVLVCFVTGGCGGSVSTTPASGMACAFDDQCGGGRCSASGDGCGVCLTPRKLGEACTGPLDACARSATCTGGVCVSTKKVVGQTCALGPGGLLPVDEQECDDELYCEASEVTGTSGICQSERQDSLTLLRVSGLGSSRVRLPSAETNSICWIGPSRS